MCDFTIMLLSILGGVHSFLNGVCEKRYEASCRQLMAECIAAVLAGWICPYISRHLLSLNPLQARCRRYSRGER